VTRSGLRTHQTRTPKAMTKLPQPKGKTLKQIQQAKK
jgi:hypothetical protein